MRELIVVMVSLALWLVFLTAWSKYEQSDIKPVKQCDSMQYKPAAMIIVAYDFRQCRGRI